MYGLIDRADILLAELGEKFVSGVGSVDVSSDDPDLFCYKHLGEMGMIVAQGAWGMPVAIVLGITPEGYKQINRVRQSKLAAGFPILNLKEDYLIRLLASMEDANDLSRLNESELLIGMADEYCVLYAEGLVAGWMDVTFAFEGLTAKGRQYVAGLIPEILEGERVVINNNPIISPIFNNDGRAYSHASSFAVSSSEIDFTSAFNAVDGSSLEESEKRLVKEALVQMDVAAKQKNQDDFLSATEKISSVAKDFIDIGSAVLPVMAKLFTAFFGSSVVSVGEIPA